MKGLWDWDTKHKRSQEKSSATLILVHSSSLSLGLCSERAPMSQLGQGAPRGHPSVLGAGNAVTHGATAASQPRAPPPLGNGNPESFFCQRVIPLPAAGHLPAPHHSTATLAQGAQRYPRLCPHKGAWFGTVSPRSASNPAKLHPVPKTSA